MAQLFGLVLRLRDKVLCFEAQRWLPGNCDWRRRSHRYKLIHVVLQIDAKALQSQAARTYFNRRQCEQYVLRRNVAMTLSRRVLPRHG